MSPEEIFKVQYRRMFKNIYTAGQCGDIDDVMIALTMLGHLSQYCHGHYTAEMIIRLRSLTRKKKTFLK